MNWTQTDRINTGVNTLHSFWKEYQAIVKFANKQKLDHNEVWRGYCEQRKEIMKGNLLFNHTPLMILAILGLAWLVFSDRKKLASRAYWRGYNHAKGDYQNER